MNHQYNIPNHHGFVHDINIEFSLKKQVCIIMIWRILSFTTHNYLAINQQWLTPIKFHHKFGLPMNIFVKMVVQNNMGLDLDLKFILGAFINEALCYKNKPIFK